MSHNSNDREAKDKEKQETTEEDLDFNLDDFDEEIIDLIEPLEEEGAESDDSSADEEILDEDGDLSLEDFDVEMELGEDDPSSDSTLEPFEGQEGSRTDSANESEAAAGEREEGSAEGDIVTDEALAELFASHESEVAKLLQEAGVSPGEDEAVPAAQPTPASEEEVVEDLFADLEVEAEGVSEEGDISEPAPVSEEELPEDLFADLEMEAEGVSEESDISEPAPVSEEELPEDLFADLEMEAEGVSEEGDISELVPADEEDVSAEVVTDFEVESESAVDETVAAASALASEDRPEDAANDFERELDSVIDETVVAASALDIEEEAEYDVTDSGGEPGEVGQMDIPEEIPPATAEELAALVSGQVEEIVTRLVEEQLPAIVERLVAQEIEKIKNSLESEE